MSNTKKPWPSLKTDTEAENFVDSADLSAFNWSQARPVSFEFQEKKARVNMRLPTEQLARIKAEAAKRDMKYQRFMRELLDRGLQTLG